MVYKLYIIDSINAAKRVDLFSQKEHTPTFSGFTKEFPVEEQRKAGTKVGGELKPWYYGCGGPTASKCNTQGLEVSDFSLA